MNRLKFELPKIHDPEHRALRHGGRTAVVMCTGFFIGHFALHNNQLAVLASFTGAALLGLADFTGDRPHRMLATAITAVVGVPLVILGTAVSLHTAAATISMFIVALVIAFGAVFSGYFAAGANAAIVFFVVAVGIPDPTSTIPSRLWGLALGGALSIVASGWLWPTRAVASSLKALAVVYGELADAVETLAAGGLVNGPDQRNMFERSVLNAELAVASSAWRPGGLTRAHKSRMYLLHGARRIATLVQQMQPIAPGTPAAYQSSRQSMLKVQATTLRDCARALGTNCAVRPDIAAAEAAKIAFDVRAADALQVRIAAGSHQSDIDQQVANLLTTLELARATVLAALHTGVIFGLRPERDATLPNSVLATSLTVGVPSVRKWLRRARRNLTFRSVHLQNSLRLATSLALARAAVGIFDLKHGFWVLFATLVVVKTSAAGTRKTALGAAVGTAIGFGISTGLIAVFGVHIGLYCILLPFVAFAAFYLPGAVSFLLGQAFFTMVVVFLFNILDPTGWTVGLLRFEDVAIGAAIGLVVGAIMWPRGAASELAKAIADLIDSGNDVAASLVRSLLRGDSSIEDVSKHCFPATVAAATAEDVFSQYLTEMHVPPAPVLAWSTLMGTAHQLWYGAVVIGGLHISAVDEDRVLHTAIATQTDVMQYDYQKLATSLREGAQFSIDPPPGPSGPASQGHPETTFRLLEIQAWVQGILANLDGIDSSLRAAISPDPVPASR